MPEREDEQQHRMNKRFGALPLGEFHAEGVCAFCGHKARILGAASVTDELREDTTLDYLQRTVHRATLAGAHICVNTVACERRRYGRRAKNKIVGRTLARAGVWRFLWK